MSHVGWLATRPFKHAEWFAFVLERLEWIGFLALVKSWIAGYLKEQARVDAALPVEEVAAWIGILRQAREEGRMIFVCGNGGNAANASHFATDLGKGASGLVAGVPRDAAESRTPRFRVLSLNENVSWMTALANDLAYEEVFVEPLKNYARKGDVLLGVSVSGNSPNVVRAMEWAKGAGLRTLALLGGRAGSRMAAIAERVIAVDSTHYGRAEDAQMHVLHLLSYAFIEGKA